ncbi:hypothetical protein [Candidatus Kuenenia sp.]|uniref:hypothetical protein n=1 Tax=Candidatus Kuenenia sp. TaxID=2499824 RepID=UPI00322001B9
MALQIGDVNATSGMSKAIFDHLDSILMSQEEKNKLKPQDLENIRKGWRKLAVAIAAGVIEHITANMEVFGVQTQGNVSAAVTGSTAVQNNVIFTQSNDGTGLVQ